MLHLVEIELLHYKTPSPGTSDVILQYSMPTYIDISALIIRESLAHAYNYNHSLLLQLAEFFRFIATLFVTRVREHLRLYTTRESIELGRDCMKTRPSLHNRVGTLASIICIRAFVKH